MSEIKFSEPQEYIVTTTQQVNLFLAGVGSGKTHLGGFISGYLLQNFPEVFGFIGANTYNQLTTSTLFRTREVWAELFGWYEGVDYVVNKKPPRTFNTDKHNFDDYNGIISFKWGALAFKGSLDNAKAHDGKEFGWAILDETKDSREEDVKETILTRLRMVGIYLGDDNQLHKSPLNKNGTERLSFNPLYVLTSPAKVRWINEWFELDEYQHEILAKIYDHDEFFKKEFKDKSVVISSTYHNRENLPKGYIQKQLDNNTAETGKKLIYGNPFVKAGGEFYSGFDRTIHVRKSPHKPHLPIHISFDQNVVPYITATLYQAEMMPDGYMEITQFDEMCLKNPNNKTAKLCLEFIKRWGAKCVDIGLFIYGDPSGKKSDTRGLEHDYKIIERMLRRYLNNSSNRVPYSHPPIIKRGQFINELFEGLHKVRIFIDPKCKNSINDFDFVKEDPNGKKLKERYKDKATGQTYEKYGHCSDAFDYFICKILEKLFERYKK